MMDGNKNKGSNGDFDDDAFDAEDFSEADFDEASFDENEFADVSADDVEYADENFADDDWQDESNQSGKKNKSSYSGEKKGLSFNAIVIIGAVVVGGGVMAMTIMNNSAKVASGEPSMFQSMLDISGVMDGTFFGGGEKADSEQAAAEQQNQDQGFLNNPDLLTSPPSPTPISPSETATPDAVEPLTPMPDMAGEMPRGPDEQQQDVAVVPETPAEPVQPAEENLPKAEDILKQAMANRDKKAESETPSTATEVAPETVTPPAQETIAQVETQQPAVPETPVLPEPATSQAPSEALSTNTQAVAALESRIDTLLKRMDEIESELGSIRDTKDADYEQIEQTVQSLKTDIASIKSKPVVVTKPAETEKAVLDEAEEVPAPVKKKTSSAAKPAAEKSKPVAAVSAPSSAKSGQWELRAAQPGRAWVSKPGERDMQGVEVGQTLAGIGRVTAITYQNGRWSIIGTQGQIQQ